MPRWNAALAILALSAPAAAQEKTIDEMFENFLEITDAIGARCDAAWPDNKEELSACWNTQVEAYAPLSNLVNAPESSEAAALLECTKDDDTWEEVDWVEAKKCVDAR